MAASSISPQTIVIRADASSTIGTGHVMRMIALAQGNRRRGGRTIFITALCSDFLSERLTQESFAEEKISPAAPGDSSDAQLTGEVCLEVNPDWLIIDGYQFGETYHQVLHSTGTKILCLDDFGHCEKWHCDALLNQNLGAEKLAPAIEQTLAGTRFALLREEFLDRPPAKAPSGPVRKLLITLGGSDPQNATTWLLEELEQVIDPKVQVRVIIGPSNPHRDELISRSFSFPIEWRTDVKEMPAEYLWADAIISAGGSSCWEWLYYRLRGAVLTIADNQEESVAELKSQKVALSLGWPHGVSRSDLLSQWLSDPSLALDQDHAARLIDGRGADRVMAVLDGSHCLIRSVDPHHDAKFTFQLANEPSVRSAGFSTDEILWETHCEWLKRNTDPSIAHLFVIEDLFGTPCGTLRFMQRDSGWEIGIAISPVARGKRFAEKAIKLGMSELARRHQIQHYLAVIKPENVASRTLFEGLGFQLDSTTETETHWSYHFLP
ncbi:UDP-2,4-diacetamido-2,4,6-trideoxy-beta-L-altropyranose hydrolase [Akkermansiaceae bacterium]|nr:UDP-2,4-diacetamido-2,4,6-trideoxy-beta-L-altropyranose hydrolase [Akkermansiaceae bacterium]MDB4499031.1 UDP-2,4-diacetamido-2,4,6-trideoxy-beta-L-altropyranose hydrolase [Akkermansiaceae bacterium]